MDICNGVVFYFQTAVILCNVLFVVAVWGLYCYGYIDIRFPRRKRRNQTHPAKVVENNTSTRFTRNGLFFVPHTNQLTLSHTELEKERPRVATLTTELKIEKKEKENALKRLSASMSCRLRDGNSNAVDHSDQNHPVNIGEQLSELYNNQWTDAYSAVETYFGQRIPEPDIIKILLHVIEQCFNLCKKQADRQMNVFRENDIIGKTERSHEDLNQRIKEERKPIPADEGPGHHEVLQQIQKSLSDQHTDIRFLQRKEVENYVNGCLRLCWLMVTQEPPMTLLFRPVDNSNYAFKEYKHRGNRVAFVVWPALLLEEKGSLVMKGVAEFCK